MGEVIAGETLCGLWNTYRFVGFVIEWSFIRGYVDIRGYVANLGVLWTLG